MHADQPFFFTIITKDSEIAYCASFTRIANPSPSHCRTPQYIGDIEYVFFRSAGLFLPFRGGFRTDVRV